MALYSYSRIIALITQSRVEPGIGAAEVGRVSAGTRAHANLSELARFLCLAMLSALFWVAVVNFPGPGKWLSLGLNIGLGAATLWQIFRRRAERGLALFAYLAAIEPIARSYGFGFGYLLLEYLAILAGVIAIFRYPRALRWPVVALAGIVVLEIIGLSMSTNIVVGRSMVVFSASRLGFILIAIAAALTPGRTLGLLRAFVIGTLSMAALVGYSVFIGEVEWGGQASFEASAGMGPNQVGFILAFGGFTTLALSERVGSGSSRWVLLVTVALQVLCAILTFTRGAALVFVVCTVLYLSFKIIRQPGSSLRAAGIIALLFAAAAVSVTVTDEAIVKRYGKQGVSRRDEIVGIGWGMFEESPIFGVGTGNFRDEAAAAGFRGGQRTGAHNELVRMLAEHGFLGGLVYIVFLVSCWRRVQAKPPDERRLLCYMWFLLAVLYEVHSGMKLASQAFLMALACEAFACMERLPSSYRATRDRLAAADPPLSARASPAP